MLAADTKPMFHFSMSINRWQKRTAETETETAWISMNIFQLCLISEAGHSRTRMSTGTDLFGSTFSGVSKLSHLQLAHILLISAVGQLTATGYTYMSSETALQSLC